MLAAGRLGRCIGCACGRWRRQLNVRFEERLAERTRIAQELHDTLLQGFLSASMQLHVAADRCRRIHRPSRRLAHVLDSDEARDRRGP